MLSPGKRALTGYLFALGATALWSGNFIVARGLSTDVPPVSLAFWRWTVAVLVFLPFAYRAVLTERMLLLQHIRYLSLTAFLGVTVFNTLIYLAGHTTSALNLSLIAITFPVFIIVFSRWLYGEPITGAKVAGIVLVALGVLLLVTRGELQVLTGISFAVGDLWMLGASIIFAVYSLLVRRQPEHMSIWAFQLSTFTLGLLFLLPFFLWERMTGPAPACSASTFFSILYIGIFASLCAFVMWNKAIIIIGPAKAGFIYYTIPLFSGVLAFLFLGEEIGMLHLGSAVLIVSGILIANRRQTT